MITDSQLKFPDRFLWGAATAAHQVEGGNINSNWWAWEQKGGGAEPSGIACDHYNRFEQDFELAKSLGHNAHRLSIEWARIEPREGKWDKEAICHYQKVLQSLKEKNMKTFVTLFHFTLPFWFAQKGGFEKKENIGYFNRFANQVLYYFKDLTDFWLTVNEPNIYVGSSYLKGIWPPQKRSPLSTLNVYLNLAAAHKSVYKSIHNIKKDAKVGIAANISAFHSFGSHLIGTAISKISNFLFNDSFYFLTQDYHDFLGVNYYLLHNFSAKDFFLIKKLNLKSIEQTMLLKRSDLGWPIYPRGIYEVVMNLKKYELPIYITENGIADATDKYRERFIINHLQWLHQAIKEGADVRGYLHWTLLDNFEWAFGFKPRFGLIKVDFQTQERKIRKSALTCANICKNNALVL
ncbi:MAG: glycoside hydrolase family 1 protein [Candidatus Cloacimonetes bacterium]|nr:glycoside hydrolase family 1 protein [Candidatus Cloacimonadota bacterium]